MKDFNAKQVKDQVVEWIRDWFEENGKGCNAVLGVSGGKVCLFYEGNIVRRVISAHTNHELVPELVRRHMCVIFHTESSLNHCCLPSRRKGSYFPS